MNKIFYITAAVAMIFTGCAKTDVSGDGEIIADDGVMHFNVDYPSTRATENAFESGDKIGVYVTGYEGDTPLALQLGGNYRNNTPVTFNGKDWVSSPVIYWGEESDKYDVFAYYPFCNPTSVEEMPFDVALDQSKPEKDNTLGSYEASDFLFASRKGVTSADGKVDLVFRHRMSRLTVVLKKGENFEGEIPYTGLGVFIHNTVTSSLIDLSTGDVVKDPKGSANTIITLRESRERFSAIIVPQIIAYRQPLIEVYCNGVSYLVETKFHFKSGTQHIIYITLNKNPDQVKIEIGGEIDGGWN